MRSFDPVFESHLLPGGLGCSSMRRPRVCGVPCLFSNAVCPATCWTHHERSGQTAPAVRQWTRAFAVSCECCLMRNSYGTELALVLRFSGRQARAVLHGPAWSTWSCLRLAEARLVLFLPSIPHFRD